MKPKQYELEESLGYLVGRAGRSMGARLNRNFTDAGFDVTCEQWAVLMNLWNKNGQSQQELAGITCKDKTSVTRLIDGLEKRDLVVRTPDKIDRRQKLIYLTNKGKNLQQRLIQIVQKTLLDAQKGISPKEIAICKKVLRSVYENMSG